MKERSIKLFIDRWRIFIVLLIVRVLFFEVSEGQLLPFREYTVRDGLISNSSNCLYQDSRGYLWIGTRDGLSRYDGDFFKNHTTQNGLSNNDIRAIIEQNSAPGTIWAATADGELNRITEKGITVTRIPFFDAVDHITSFVQSKSGKIYCGSEKGGLYSITDSIVSKLSLTKALTNITQMALLNDTLLYLCGYDGIFAYSIVRNDVNEISFSGSEKFNLLNVFAVCLDSSGYLWASLSGKAIFKIQGTNIIARKFVSDMGNLFLVDDGHGFLWSGSYSGLFKMSKQNFPLDTVINYKTNNGLPDIHIRSGLIDRENDLWIGCEGILKLTNLSFFTMPLQGKSLSQSTPYSSAQDSHGHIWIASDSGIGEYFSEDGCTWKNYFHSLHDQIRKNEYRLSRVLTIDGSNNLWVVNYQSGLECYSIEYHSRNSSRLSLIKRIREGIEADCKFIRWMHFDRKGRLWVSVKRTGVYVLDPRLKHPLVYPITQSNGLPGNDIISVYEDRHGNVWFGSKDNGVCLLKTNELDAKSLHVERVPGSYSSKDNSCIVQDQYNLFWYGTSTGIVRSFDTPPTAWDIEMSLPQYPVYCMYEDSLHRLWFGTSNGIFYLQNAASRITHWIDQSLGMPVFAIGKERENNIWFVSENVLGIFSLAYEHSGSPPIMLTQFYNNDEDVLNTGDFRFNYFQNNCRFHFVGISFHEEKPLEFKYCLLGSTHEWSEPTNQTNVGYLSLKPGSYRFLVKAVDNDGIESTIPAEVSFTILRPYWFTWWFISGCAFLIGSVLYGLYRLRLRHFLAIEQMKAHIASDLHDDLASNLSGIAMLSELLHNEDLYIMDKERKAMIIERIITLSHESVDAVRDIIWAIDPRHETLSSLLLRFRDTLLASCQPRNILLEFPVHSIENLPTRELSPDERKNLWLLLKEAFTNAIKHSDCTKLMITVKRINQIVAIDIHDNGKGFDIGSKHYNGKGLLSMKRRAEHLNGGVELISVPGVGTEVKIRIDLRK